jgi:hypothetical protein
MYIRQWKHKLLDRPSFLWQGNRWNVYLPIVIFTCPGQAASVKLHICEAIPSPLSLPLRYTVSLKQTFTINYFVPCRHRDSLYTRRESIQKRRQTSVLSLCVHTARMKSDKLQRIPVWTNKTCTTDLRAIRNSIALRPRHTGRNSTTRRDFSIFTDR